NRNEIFEEIFSQSANMGRQRISEIFVFTGAKAEVLHFDAGTKETLIGVRSPQRACLLSIQNSPKASEAVAIERCLGRRPVKFGNPLRKRSRDEAIRPAAFAGPEAGFFRFCAGSDEGDIPALRPAGTGGEAVNPGRRHA